MTDERQIVRNLAKQYMDIALTDAQRLTRENWGRLNSLKSARPTITLDQIPWHEMNIDDELTCVCTDNFLRSMEYHFRVSLYRHKHFPADLVMTPFYRVGKHFSNGGGIGVSSVNQDESDHAGAQTHVYADQLPDDDALDKLRNYKITYDAAGTQRTKNRVEDIIGDIMPVNLSGTMLWLAVWDEIVFWRGATTALYSLIDDDEYVHRMMRKLTDIKSDLIDQLEENNLLDAGPGAYCHCMETYLDEPRKEGFDPDHIRAADCWVSGAAQIFSEVSPDMHDEFEIEYLKPIYDRFGWVNYGCCEPLHKKIDIVKKLNTVRAISISPWADVNIAAEAMGKDYMMARKPNPAFVASGYPDVDSVRKETRETLKACVANGTNVEFILKDITTVNNRPQCLTEWYELVKSEIENF